MSNKVPPPLFTLRGHKNGVTTLESEYLDGSLRLISGDESGSVIIWDLATFKQVCKPTKLTESRIQSLKVIHLLIKNQQKSILVCQSRDHGVDLFDIDPFFQKQPQETIKSLANFASRESLFSRGDAIDLSQFKQAVIAYPSSLTDEAVTVRILTNDAETKTSGTATRHHDLVDRKLMIFDISLQPKQGDESTLLLVAYEDAHLCVYSFSTEQTRTVPELGSTGLKIELKVKIDLGYKDFVSAFDSNLNQETLHIISGSPLKELLFIEGELNDWTDKHSIKSVELKSKGVSAISMRPDKKLVAVASWDNNVHLISMKSRKPLATLRDHRKQVTCILYVQSPKILLETSDGCSEYLTCCASMDATISIHSIY